MIAAGVELNVISGKPLSGGCIGSVELLETSSDRFVLKRYNRSGIAKAESTGLAELFQTNTIRVPEVIAATDSEILMEYIEPGRKRGNFEELLAQGLAALHRHTSSSFGFHEDNWIGDTPQINSWNSNWSQFYMESRLEYQIKRAENQGIASKELRHAMETLIPKVDSLLKGTEESPALIHGDLWSGNYFVSTDGSPFIIDPAVYYAHREAELGMIALFGGVSQRFYDAYNESNQLKDGWQERIPLYKLYHLLNHLNLFGKSYERECISTAKCII